VTPDVESAVDSLYAGDPDEFVASRDRLARELNKAGDKAAAAAVKKLRRPSVSAAALNALARSDAAGVDELLALGERLAAAQKEAVTGGGAAALRELTTARRKLVSRLGALAGNGLTAAARGAVNATLEAATTDPDVGERLRAGRLTTEASAAGFGLDLFALAETTEARPPREGAAKREARGSRLTLAPDPEPRPVRKAAKPAKPGRRPAGEPAADDRAAAQAAEDARQKREIAAVDEQAVAEAKAEVAARDRALKEAKKALVDAQRKAQRSELAAASAEHKAWELGERHRSET
jgi:hypothetical protein